MFPVTRRELLGRTVLGVQILLLAACGGDDEDEVEQPRAAPTAPQASVPRVAREQVTVRLASVMDQFDRAVRSAIEQWNEGGVSGAPEGVVLERTGGPSVAPSRNTLQFVGRAQEATKTFLTEKESAGTPPDLFLFNRFFDFPWVFRSGLVQPLDRFLQQDRTEPLESFLQPALKLVRFRSQTMALPVAVDVGVSRYSPRQFERTGISLPDNGWTREEFVDAAQRLTQDTDNDGNVDAWGFRPIDLFANWLPFVLQELDEDPINLDTGAVRLTDPAALRGLQFWEELGRLHRVMPHGATVTADQFAANFTSLGSAILFWVFMQPSSNLPGRQAPLPTGPQDVTTLTLSGALTIPSVASDSVMSYEALRPLALNLGERLLLPPVTGGQQFIENPTSDYLELALPEHERQLVLHLLDTSRPSLLATSLVMTNELFERLALPLARGELGVEQAAQQAQNWLESYLKE